MQVRPRPRPPRCRPDRGADIRWSLSAERALLAWFRLALASFVLGAALLAIVPPHVAPVPVGLLATVLMIGCAAAALIGLHRWHCDEKEHSGH